MLCRAPTLAVLTLAFLTPAGCSALGSRASVDAYYAQPDAAPLPVVETVEAPAPLEFAEAGASTAPTEGVAAEFVQQPASEDGTTEPMQASAPPAPPLSQRERAIRQMPPSLRRHVPTLKLERFRNVRGREREALYARIDSNTDVEDKVGLLVAILATDGEQDLVILHSGGLLSWSCEGTAWVRSEMVRQPERALETVGHGLRHYGRRLRMGQLPSDAQLWMRAR